jgi:uncharacterized protein YciI
MCRLIGPRPTFPADITPEEGAVMKQHAGYWTELLGQGKAVFFGPVAEPQGVWGLGLLQVDSAEEAAAIVAKDPTVRSGRGFRFEHHPVLGGVARP